MWARKQIDVGYLDLLRAIWLCLFPGSKSSSVRRICQSYSRKFGTTTDEARGSSEVFACLSVRSGFDLLLQSFGWEQDSEIIVSDLTIADMPRIIEKHGFKAVGVDISLRTLAPNVEEIESRITPRTKAILIAHLMGSRFDAAPIAKLAREHDLILIEDCAQAFSGTQWAGSPGADVSMFSFGPIKTNTALGGGLFFIKDPSTTQQMNDIHRCWPQQSRIEFAKRVCKYGFIKLISCRPIVWLLYCLIRIAGRDHDEVFSKMAKGFSGPNFFQRIRKQPSNPLLSLMASRIKRFSSESLRLRTKRGDRLKRLVSVNGELVPGEFASSHSYWVMPIIVENREELATTLWKAGFDATPRSSLVAHSNAHFASKFLKDVLFVPTDLPMPPSELDRMAKIIRQIAIPGLNALRDEFNEPGRTSKSNANVLD